MDKSFIKEIVKSMQGVFLPKEEKQDVLVKEISDSLRELEFYGSSNDRKNMREDVASLNREINKVVNEAKIKFNAAF